MKNKIDLYAAFTIICGIVLFGSIIASAITGDGIYFVFGYPVAGVFLFVATFFRPKNYGR